MDSLNLRTAPPRSARAALAGIVFLPRTIDKIRATLPAGDLGDYSIEGFSTMMLDRLGIDVAALTAAVAAAVDEDDVARFVTTRAAPGSTQAWNGFISKREVFNGDRPAAIAEFPWLADHPNVRLSVDFLDEDDRRSFAQD